MPDKYCDATEICWGWVNDSGVVQAITFSSSSGALAEMCKRLSFDISKDTTIDNIYALGFRLAQVRKTVSVVRVLR